MELQSPPFLCPSTVTVRRNPHRKARQAPPAVPFVDTEPGAPAVPPETTENLRVYLRIRRPELASRGISARGVGRTKSARVMGGGEPCLVAADAQSVVLAPPRSIGDTKRLKQEVFEGFARVFSSESSQEEIYVSLFEPMVETFLRGKSGLLVAMGPTGSGKTHTVFGTPREPGLVPRAFNRIFGPNFPSDVSGSERSYSISMFELYSDKGRSEKPIDLLSSGTVLHIQESTVRGLSKTNVSNVTEAQCVISRGLLGRTTAGTNANNKSSRSQCVISIHSSSSIGAALTIIDLAGAERESKTGNQGARLLESNFINNTSMVFGQCLRSLLEHQKNPKRPLQKLYHSSLLTKYLRDYLEGKKQMTLLLTVKREETDYQETSFLLRQASPFMNIKYAEADSSDVPNLKRQASILARTENLKRRKCTEIEASETCDKTPLISAVQSKVEDNLDKNLYEELLKEKRQNLVTLGFLQAMWKMLKEYKLKFEESSNEVEHQKVSVRKEKSLNAALKKELTDVKSCLMDHGKTLEGVGYDLQLVEGNISRLMSSHVELENTSEDIRVSPFKDEEREVPFHLEASEVSVKEKLGDGNICIPLTCAALEIVQPIDNVPKVSSYEAEFKLAPFVEVENNSENFHISSVKSEEREIASHLEASKGSVNEKLEDDNLFVSITFAAVENAVSRDAGFEQGSFVEDSLENNSVDFHVSSFSKEREMPSHLETCEGSINERLGDDNVCVPHTAALLIVDPTENAQNVANYDTKFALRSLVEFVESATTPQSCSGSGHIDGSPKKNGDEPVLSILVNEKKPVRTRKLAPASSVLWKEMNGVSVEEEYEKSNRGRKKQTDERTRSRGNETLVRMLRNNLRF